MSKFKIKDKFRPWIKSEVKNWLKKAEKDLSDAEFNLIGNRLEVAAFLAHQSAEKALKALYILRFKRLWKIHDLVELGRKISASPAILKTCEALNPHYIETRYPIEVEYDEAKAKEALENARKVVKWARRRLQKKS